MESKTFLIYLLPFLRYRLTKLKNDNFSENLRHEAKTVISGREFVMSMMTCLQAHYIAPYEFLPKRC